MYYQEYFKNVNDTLEAVLEQETGKIQQAGAILAEVLKGDGLLYVFGCGHSHMLAEELFYRAGGWRRCTPFSRPPPCSTRGQPRAARSSG